MTKADEAWGSLFQKYDILSQIDKNQIFEITANQIKDFYEPRLITKYDWSSSLPKLFKDNELSILPSSRGTYTIGRFDAYKKLKINNIKPISMKLPNWIRTWDKMAISSEAVALNAAKASGMIDYIMQSSEEVHAVETITGRLKSGNLDYQIKLKNKVPYNFHVNNAQVEIDGGYENDQFLAVIEAKSVIPPDFIIRQLYHPYRVYNNLDTGKPVLPFYFTYVDDIFNFYQYEFTELKNYSSIKFVKQYSFILDKTLNLSIEAVKRISADFHSKTESTEYPYPQANTFQMVLDTMKHIEEPKNKEELAELFQFDVRQSDYYANSLAFLGFAKRESGIYSLTELGKRVNSLPNSNMRNEIIIKQILSHVTFRSVFDSYLKNDGNVTNEYIDQTLKKYVKKIGKNTIERRRSTVKQWIAWIFSVIE